MDTWVLLWKKETHTRVYYYEECAAPKYNKTAKSNIHHSHWGYDKLEKVAALLLCNIPP
jgi:hypothetical protein